MDRKFEIRGTVRIDVPFRWKGSLDEATDDEFIAAMSDELGDWEPLARSHMVEDAIQQAIVNGQFDIDENDIEIDVARELKDGTP